MEKTNWKNSLNQTSQSWGIILFLCVVPGLMPIFPEPHIWGKLKWIWGGAEGMALIDYGDVLLHGFPWILLLRLILLKVFKK